MDNKVMTVNNQAMTAGDVRKQVNLIQEVMEAVMKKDEHYGIIPGCKKPSLFKPGAEKLCMTFRLSPDYEELSGTREEDNFISYKIKCSLIYIPTGEMVGHGLGACNSKEKKYKERSVYPNRATAEEKSIGREEEKKSQSGNYKVIMVPVDPWEIQNTLYKMACKRALIAAVLNATAASDCFSQDIEDLPAGMVAEEAEVTSSKPKVRKPERKKDTEKKEENVQGPALAAQLKAIDSMQGTLDTKAIESAFKKAGVEGTVKTFDQACKLITALGEEVTAKRKK